MNDEAKTDFAMNYSKNMLHHSQVYHFDGICSRLMVKHVNRDPPALTGLNIQQTADTVGLLPFAFRLLRLYTFSPGGSILYALNLVGQHRDVLKSALLQSQGCLHGPINWESAWCDLFTKHK